MGVLDFIFGKPTKINNDFFGISLDKKQIIGKLKRNTFDTSQVFKMLEFLNDNEDLKEDQLD